MPAVFLGHGSPMNALETNRYTTAWRSFGRTVTRPRAILVISAHWYVNTSAGDRDAPPRTGSLTDRADSRPSANLPDPAVTPADDTNV